MIEKIKKVHEVNLSETRFPLPEKQLEEESVNIFTPSYYKAVLTGEGEAANRLHSILSKYLHAADAAEKGVWRLQIVSAFWNVVNSIAPKMGREDVSVEKRYFLRFGLLLPTLLSDEHRDFFSKVIFSNPLSLPILYLDEWMRDISNSFLTNSTTDEKRHRGRVLSGEEAKAEEQKRFKELQSKNSGKMQSIENILNNKEREREQLEQSADKYFALLTEHAPCIGYAPHTEPYTEGQKRTLSELLECLRRMSRNDKELSKTLSEYKELKKASISLEGKIDEDFSTTDSNAVELEAVTVRQMAKMSVGRRGNSFPILTDEFYHSMPKTCGTRENVLGILSWIESLDTGVFLRQHKSVYNRIPPYVLLLPTYGNYGFCWEPFDRYNRTTSRGRIIVPMYPKDLRIAVLTAVADLRWQVAKEKASYYWMEEGLTGQYYQYIERQKMKGDLKSFFIEDYILYMTKESEGIQRLDKEVRGIFWRLMPFPDDVKQELKKRSLVYAELCQKDANRAMSDGY